MSNGRGGHARSQKVKSRLYRPVPVTNAENIVIASSLILVYSLLSLRSLARAGYKRDNDDTIEFIFGREDETRKDQCATWRSRATNFLRVSIFYGWFCTGKFNRAHENDKLICSYDFLHGNEFLSRARARVKRGISKEMKMGKVYLVCRMWIFCETRKKFGINDNFSKLFHASRPECIET